MATQRRGLATYDDGLVQVWYDYDDVSRLLLDIGGVNNGSQSVWVQITDTTTGLSAQGTFPPGFNGTRDVTSLNIVGTVGTGKSAGIVGFPIAVQGRYPA